MGKLIAVHIRDARGYESSRKLIHNAKILESFDETFDGATDNLLSRKRNNDPQESFSYDNLDRLVSVKSGAAETMKISYAPNGNILFKTGVGNFSYDKNVRPHAVTEVENTDGKIPGDALTTSFNDFGKIQLIEDAGKSLRMDFSYGPDQERWYSELSKNDTDVRTTVYAGEYEKITENGVTREFYYLDGNTIVIRENGTVRNYHAFTDNLGSILCVMDENGTKVFDASYDAWGKQTVTLNSIGLHRGYTGHEMLSEFDIINMNQRSLSRSGESNGRLYAPVLGRFFSPDNYVQMPDNSQSFNRYSYCLNNPLKYTDPSGNLFGIDDAIIAFAAFSMGSSMMQAAFECKSVWKAGALSLLSSAASYGIGEAFKNVASTFGNELLRAGAHGLASGVVSALDGGNFASAFVSGAAASGIGSYAKTIKGLETWQMVSSTTAMGGVVAWATGGDFLQGAMQGMNIGFLNHAMHDDPPSVSTQQEDQNLQNMLPEVVVTAKRISVETLITKIVYAGTLVNKYRSQGTYTMYYGDKQLFSCNAVSGASNCKSYTIPDGDWYVVSISDRSEPRFTSDGVGFTANIDPDPFYDSRAGRNRQYIRIHPARSNGTNGCIGLRANKAQLIRARDLIRKSLNKGLTIKLHVQIGEN